MAIDEQRGTAYSRDLGHRTPPDWASWDNGQFADVLNAKHNVFLASASTSEYLRHFGIMSTWEEYHEWKGDNR